MNVEIAQRLAELRRKKGYSQEALANALGLSRQAVSKWERAESSPDTENLIAIAKLYGVSLDELIRVAPEVEDDVAFENAERAERAEREAAMAAERTEREAADAEARAADRATAAQAAEAAAQASRAAARAAEAAAQASQNAEEGKRRRGPWRSFPYGVVATLLFFILGFWGSFKTSWLIFLTIPLYHWLANIMDGALAREEHAEFDGSHRPSRPAAHNSTAVDNGEE